MEEPLKRGDVVVIRFPFSDLSATKRRPALVLAALPYGDLILAQITSKAYADTWAIPLGLDDFETGGLPITSFVRPGKLFTAADTIVEDRKGEEKPLKYSEIVKAVSTIIGG